MAHENRGLTRRRLIRTMGASMLGASSVAILAACGEVQTVTEQVPVEKIVVKEVPVERIVEKTVVKEVPVDRIVTQEVSVDRVVTKEVPVEKVVERIVTREVTVEKIVEVQAAPQAAPVAFEFISDHTGGPRAKSMQFALDRYKQVRPNANVVFVPNSGNIGDTIPIRIAAGSMSEVALLDGRFVFDFGPDGVFQPIDDLLDKHPEFNKSDYVFQADQYTANLDTTWPFLDEWTGPVYGLPYQMGNGGFWFNVDLFEAAGAEEPQQSWSYGGELLDAIMRLTNEEAGIFGTLFKGGSDTFAYTHALFAFGAKQYVSPDADRTVVFENGGDAGMQYIIDIIHKHSAAPPVDAARELAGEFGDLFLAGKAGMYFKRTGNVGPAVAQIKDRFTWSEAPMPTSEVTGTFNVFRQSQPHLITDSAFKRGNVEGVVDFIVFMAGPEVQGRNGIDRGFAPIRWDVLDMPGSVAPPPLGMEWQKVILQDAEWRSWPKWHPSWAEWNGWRSFIHKAFAGEQSAPEAIETTVAYMDTALGNSAEEMQRRFEFFGRTT